MYGDSTARRCAIQPGATVWSADGKRLGSVARCEADGFVLEAGLLEGDLVLDYAYLASADGTMACLTVTASEIPAHVRRIEPRASEPEDPPPSSADAARTRVVERHAELRAAMREALSCANRVLGGDAAAELALRHAAVALASGVRTHVAEEHRDLEPVLASVDAWGPERCAKLEAQHRTELCAVEDTDEAAFGLECPQELARCVRHAIAAVLRCLRREEREILDNDLLTDDPVRVDQLTD